MDRESRKRKLLENVSVDDFMTEGFDDSDESSISEENSTPTSNKKLKTKPGKKSQAHEDKSPPSRSKPKKALPVNSAQSDDENDSDDSENIDDSDLEDSHQHKEALSRLRKKDPEFFKYLSENDKALLDFDISDDSGDEEKIHKPPAKLEVASDDSDFSADEEGPEKEETEPANFRKVTLAMIKDWTNQLEQNPNMEVIRDVMAAFQSAVEHAGDGRASNKEFVVEGNTVFNGVMRLCMTSLLPAVHKLLKLPAPVIAQKDRKPLDPTKSKLWPKMMVPMKSYLNYIVMMLTEIFESDLLMLLIRHVLYLIPFYIPFVKHSRVLLKKLIHLWSTSEESIRVLSFIGIIRLCRALPKEYLDYNLKQMYLSYVRNCKFTSPSTWPLINFMKRSLVELYTLDCSLAYQQAFVYVRQLAIHLRNALTIKKKDAFQAVYNWQYIHCLFLWSHLLGSAPNSLELRPLIYPLTQVMLGTVRLIPTCKYYPLRFQLVHALTKLSQETNTFIPVLPLILEILKHLDKKKKSLSMKQMDLTCMLKLSKPQLEETGFKDACIDTFYELTMDYLNVYAHTIGFPELVLPAVVQMKVFLKTCKVANYCRKIKQLLDKINENSEFIKSKRKSATFGTADLDKIYEWENGLKNGTPLQKYYTTWRQVKDRDIASVIAMKHHVKTRDEKLPEIKKKEHKEKDKAEFKELFISSDEEEDEDFIK